MARILLANATPAERALVRSTLLMRGHHVYEVSSGEAALGIVDRLQLDVVVADIELPDLRGEAFVDALRARPSGAFIPVVLMAEAGVPEWDVRATIARMPIERLRKPFSAHELTDAVERAVSILGEDALVALDERKRQFADVIDLQEQARARGA